jgi:hypothetical protein
MRYQVELDESARLHEIVALMSKNELVSTVVTDTVRGMLESMFKEAAEYGFTEADVVRAVLRPVFQRKAGCNCYVCAARRTQPDETPAPTGW